MRNGKLNLLWASLTALLCLVSSTARADTITVTAAITSFSGVVVSYPDDPSIGTYVRTDDGGSQGGPCLGTGPIPCGSPLYGFQPLCPDAGCGTGGGIATDVPLEAQSPLLGTRVIFKVAELTDEETPNVLFFQPAGRQDNVDTSEDFKLGTLSFTNG